VVQLVHLVRVLVVSVNIGVLVIRLVVLDIVLSLQVVVKVINLVQEVTVGVVLVLVV
jgi:hypothetical protein